MRLQGAGFPRSINKTALPREINCFCSNSAAYSMGIYLSLLNNQLPLEISTAKATGKTTANAMGKTTTAADGNAYTTEMLNAKLWKC